MATPIEGYGKKDQVAELQRVASDLSSSLHSKTHLVGNVVVLQESEMLGPAAYAAEDAGVKSFEMYGYTQNWYRTHYYEGMLEGRASKNIPDPHYLIWLFKDGSLYLKWVKGSYERIKEEIRLERIQLREAIYWAALKSNFLNLLSRIQIDKKS